MDKRMFFALVAAMGIVALTLGGCPSSKPVTSGPPAMDGGAKPADAAQQTAPPEPTTESADSTLTKAQVKSFMLSMNDRELDAAMTEIGKGMGLEKAKDFASIEKVLAKAATDPKVEKIVMSHGFKDGAEWAATALKVFPGLAHAMAVAMAKQLKIEVGSKQFDEMLQKSEFKEAADIFEKPSEADQQLIDEVFKEEMETEMKAQKGA